MNRQREAIPTNPMRGLWVFQQSDSGSSVASAEANHAA